MTAEDVAVKLIRPYVERGDSIQSLRGGRNGESCSEYGAEIAGRANGKPYSPDWIVVYRVNGAPCTEMLKLSDIYNQIGKGAQLCDA